MELDTGVAVLPGASVEFADGPFHLFARGVGRAADALDSQAEFVRVRGAHQGLFQRDQTARVQIINRLIESLHAVLAGAGGDRVADVARFVRIHNAIADEAGGNTYFDGRNAAGAVAAAHKTLADYRAQSAG